MNNEYLLYAIVLFPVAGAFLLPLAGKSSETLRNWLALTFISLSCVLSALLVPTVLAGHAVQIRHNMPFGMNIVFHADGLAVFMALISSFIGAIIVLYSFSYISHYDNRDEYYFMVILFLGSMMGLIYSGNLILMYIFWELTAVASWRLIGFFRGKVDVLRADKAFMITAFGALAMLLGFLVLYSQTGSFDLAAISTVLRHTQVSNLAVGLILLGILSKSATLPLHTWLPDAGVAPSPVTALLHAAVLVKIGVYAYARLFIVTVHPPAVWMVIVPAIAATSALISAGAALIETDIKRIIAYSTVSQIGFIFLGLAVGNPIGIAGALLYILMHGIAKGGLFLCAGIVEQKTHIKDIRQLGGLAATMPLTAISFLLCAFSVMGIPPFGGFFSKFMVIKGGIDAGQLWITAVFVLGALLTILYLFRVFIMVFFGEGKSEGPKEGSPVMVASVVTLGALSLLSGVLIYYPFHFTQTVVNQIMGIGH